MLPSSPISKLGGGQAINESGEGEATLKGDVENHINDPSIIAGGSKKEASAVFLDELVRYGYIHEIKKCEGVVYARTGKITDEIGTWTCEKDQVKDLLVLTALDANALVATMFTTAPGGEPLLYSDRLECAEALVRATMLRIPELDVKQRKDFYKRVAEAHMDQKHKLSLKQATSLKKPGEKFTPEVQLRADNVAKLVDKAKLELYTEGMPQEEKATAIERSWEAYGKGEEPVVSRHRGIFRC